MRLFLASITLVPLATVIPAGPAFAQTANISVGMQVVDTSGGPVGTVIGIKGDILTVKTDRHEVALPKNSFTPNEGKLLFGMTQAALNAATEKSLAEAQANLVAGAAVKGAGGVPVGTIDSIDSQFATIKLASGKLVRIPRSGVVGSSDGAVIGLTAAQLEAQVAPSPEAAN
ncbi:MAG TPA: hypothetical protein VFZ35_08855 [Sphingomicrobium sp.]